MTDPLDAPKNARPQSETTPGLKKNLASRLTGSSNTTTTGADGTTGKAGPGTTGPTGNTGPTNIVFRPRVGYFTCGLWAVLTVVWLVLAARAGFGEVVRQAGPASFLAALVWTTCGRPAVVVSRPGVLLRNVIRDIEVPWGALEEIDTKYALTLKTKQQKKFSAWAAPAASRFSTTRATASDLKTIQWDEANGPIPASASLRSDSGSAAAIVRMQWKQAQEAAPGGKLPTQTPTLTWSIPSILMLTLSFVAAVLCVTLGY